MSRIVSVQVGRVAPLGSNRISSGFVKRPVLGPVAIVRTGLAGDEQADHSVHGGADKAVYAYSEASYAVWRLSHPNHAALWAPGGVGENLTIAGMDEEAVCIGDVVQAGSAVLQITQPREPCFKFALRFDDAKLPKAMIANGRCGWYFRVLTPGELTAGSDIRTIERRNPGWPVSRMARFVHAKTHEPHEIDELAQLSGLAESWETRLRKLR